MDTETILALTTAIGPIVIGLIVFFITYFARGKSISEAIAEMTNAKEIAENILSFFDPEKPYCDTNDEALAKISEHPYSYCLEKDEKEIIFEGLPSEEIAKLEEVIAGYEADMNVDYTLHTSLSSWRIYYGTPTEIVPDDF